MPREAGRKLHASLGSSANRPLTRRAVLVVPPNEAVQLLGDTLEAAGTPTSSDATTSASDGLSSGVGVRPGGGTLLLPVGSCVSVLIVAARKVQGSGGHVSHSRG